MGKCSPSKLPMLAVCPCFESSEVSSVATDRGSIQHKVIEDHFREDRDPHWNSLQPMEKKMVRWAIRWINENTSTARLPEKIITASDPDVKPIGRSIIDILDAGKELHIVDYKSGKKRDSTAQLAAYALLCMRKLGYDKAKITVLYGKYKSHETRILTLAEAEAIVLPILESVESKEKKAKLCEFCSWCIHEGLCEAVPIRIRKIFQEKENERKCKRICEVATSECN